jgi:hypothetical protein
MGNPALPQNHLVHAFASSIVTLSDALVALGTIGFDDAAMAAVLGMSPEQFQQRLDEEPTWAEAWRRGKAKALGETMRSLHVGVRKGDPQATALWLELVHNRKTGSIL